MGLNKSPHHLNALRILKNNTRHSIGGEKLLGSSGIVVPVNDNSGSLAQQRSARTHDARPDRSYDIEFVRVGAASGLANAHYVRELGRIDSQNTQIMNGGDV